MRWTLGLLFVLGSAFGHSADLELSRPRLVNQGADRILEFEARYPRKDTPLFLTAVAGVDTVATLERRGVDGRYHRLEQLVLAPGVSAFGTQTSQRVRFIRPEWDARAVLTLLFSDGSAVTLSVGEEESRSSGWLWGVTLWVGAVLLGILWVRRFQRASK